MPDASMTSRKWFAPVCGLAALAATCAPSVAQFWPGAESSPFATPQQAPQAAPRAHWPRPKPRLRLIPQAALPKPEQSKTEGQPAPAADEPPPPYEPELLRLSEILGA